MAADNTYLLSQGKVWIAPRTSNSTQSGGFLWAGDADKMELSTSQKFDDVEESYTGQRLVAAHAPTGTTMSFKLNCLYLSAANIARAYYGTYSGAVTGAAVTNEAVTLYNGCMTPLAHPGVSAVTVAGMVLDTDYTIDAVNGTITILPGSIVAPDGTPYSTTVNYTFASYTGKIETFTQPITEYYIRVEGFNTMNGNAPFLANLYRCSMNLAKTLSLIDNKHTMLELDGMLLPDATATGGRSQFYTVVKS